MGKILVLALFMCSGCATYNAAFTCQQQLGPRPNGWANSFGALGAAIAGQTDENKAYEKKMDACIATQKSANP